MVFKRLELIGFKSFADKTVIQFEAGVTAIVGPNGCGKSNVSDAIRWVLGEQSARSLRGSEMLDVIFNGSSAKEPLNLAEVSLVLSNEEKSLPIDYEEVTITRRLYRSGESEYLINKNPVRLKDIHELLMGTGIGTDNYSVIEQGQMDLILNSKPEDRRVIFEEAAGITKFKSQKKEALRKLEQTEQNLVRINDIVLEVKRQIGIIERQARKAENYKIEFEKLKTLEVTVAGHEFSELEARRVANEESLALLKQQEFEGLAETQTLEQRLESEREALGVLEESMKGFTTQEMNLSSRIRQHQDRILMNRERIGELLERKENLISQIGQGEKRIQELVLERERMSQELLSAKAEEELELPTIQAVEMEFQNLDGLFRGCLSEIEAIRASRSALIQEKNTILRDQSRTEAERAALGGRLRRLRQETDSLQAELRELESRRDFFISGAQGSGADSPLSQLESRLHDFKQRLLSLFRQWLQKPSEELPAEEESRLDSELRQFSGEIFKIQGVAAQSESARRQNDESRAKIDQKLARIGEEIQALEAQEVEWGEKILSDEQRLQMVLSQENALNLQETQQQEVIRAKTAERESHLVRVTEVRTRRAHFKSRCEKMEKDLRWIDESKASEEHSLGAAKQEIEDSATRKQKLEEESLRLEQEAVGFSTERDELLRQSEGKRRERQAAQETVKKIEHQVHEKNEALRAISDRAHGLQMRGAEMRFESDKLKERIFNSYQTELAMVESTDPAFSLEEAKAQIQTQRDKLQRLGPVSLVAIEEHQEMKARYEFLTQQEQDLLKAKDDLHKAIVKINRTTRELFAETFQKIQKHFSDYYKLLFGGGHAELILLDEQDVLESGIDIFVRPPGKKLQNMTLLSGGEKALTSIALLFALFKVKPSPFCVLDEIDAPLDEANIDRFLKVLKEFITQSQFILVTHSKRTMSLANILYGITMAENGVSRVVSVKLSGPAPEAPGSEPSQGLVEAKEQGAVVL